VITERQERSVAGTVFSDGIPRIINIKGIKLEGEFAPHMLYVTNEDQPGVIGGLGTVMADHGVNIATFHLGRNKPGGDAISLLVIDQPLDDAVLKAVQAVPPILQAKPLQF
jgi:D-3-phosphoglycerate dehydrogenase